MPCWDGGAAQQPEDEREQQHAWEDPSDGDLPWAPRGPEDEEWKQQDWSKGPEERMWRDLLNNDDEADGS